MPTFQYRAYLTDGSTETGVLEASSKQEAARTLSRQGRRTYHLEQARADQRTGSAFFFHFAWGASPIRPERLFADLSMLLNAGFTIDRAVAAIAAGETSATRKSQLESVHDLIARGRSSAEAFATLPGLSPTTIALIASGERSGRLAAVCERLAASYSTTAKRKAAIIEALTYPFFLMFVMFGALFVLATVLVPALEPIFEGAGAAKPAVMSMLATLRRIILDYPVVFPMTGLLCIGAYVAFSRSNSARAFGVDLVARTPLVGTLIIRASVARYLEVLSLLLANGVTMLDALKLSGSTARLPMLRQVFSEISESIAVGSKLNEAFAGHSVFEKTTVSLVAIGEEANALPSVLERASQMLHAQVSAQIDGLLKLMTPALTILLGLMVGSLVVSVMTTILNMNELALR
ncbi:type II secretion system F family protein [Mesorhizobium sp. CC13]|uniref:type II secretion system F family protein n=1 Tax=Mesorhizobium sp. CC13 TaxID=3029194 RepID=UPI00326566CA